MAHSEIGASSYYRWAQDACPGSVQQSRGIESQSSAFAQEGTLAHEMAADMLDGNAGLIAGTTPEMREAVEVYINAVNADKTENCISLIEKSFDLSSLFPGLFGTADCVIYYPDKKLLRVYDYKHGKGIVVEVENNPQLQYYALGALVDSGFTPDVIEIVVVQPRAEHACGPVRRWQLTAVELIEYAAQLIKDAKATQQPNAPLKAGEWCRFCPAAGAGCPELKNKTLRIAQTEFGGVPVEAQKIKEQQLPDVLKWLPVMENWIKSVREFAYNEAQAGRSPLGYKLVAKRATRKWIDEQKAQLFIDRHFKINGLDMVETKLKSPAKFEKLVKKEDMELLKDHIIKKSSGNVLVPESDKRLEVLCGPVNEFEAIE